VHLHAVLSSWAPSRRTSRFQRSPGGASGFHLKGVSWQVLEGHDTCRLVLLENVPGLADADESGRSNVDEARELFDALGPRPAHACIQSYVCTFVPFDAWVCLKSVQPQHGRRRVRRQCAPCVFNGGTARPGFTFSVVESDAVALGSAVSRHAAQYVRTYARTCVTHARATHAFSRMRCRTPMYVHTYVDRSRPSAREVGRGRPGYVRSYSRACVHTYARHVGDFGVIVVCTYSPGSASTWLRFGEGQARFALPRSTSGPSTRSWPRRRRGRLRTRTSRAQVHSIARYVRVQALSWVHPETVGSTEAFARGICVHARNSWIQREAQNDQ
jgi:hypothetical protein